MIYNNLASLLSSNLSGKKTVSSSGARPEGSGKVQTADQVRNLSPGPTMSGEVVGREGDEIQIRIAKDTVVTAKMEKEVQMATGQTVTFQVRSNSSGLLALRPLFQNMAQESTALRALDQAGIEINGKSMQMVFSMMEEGMSIDKNSLQDMYRQILSVPEENISSIVQMNRLQIPVTPENIMQFEAYKNYEHQLLASFSQVAEEIPQAVLDIFATGSPREAAAFISQLLTIFEGKLGEAPGEMEGVLPSEGTGTAEAGKGGTVVGETPVSMVVTEDGSGEIIVKTAEKIVSDILEEPGSELEGSGKLDKEEGAIPKEDRSNLAALIRKAGGSSELAGQILRGEIGKEALYRAVKELSLHAGDRGTQEAVKDLFLSKGFQKIFQSKMDSQWMLTTPGSVEKESVSRLYERLNEQTRQLTQALSESVKADSPLYKSVETIRENVDFMNQLNQTYTYVQLPLKFRGENAHGELYVYTNKKSLAKREGTVSAFLHLDMEHLGMVDVYVAMEQGRINTNFYLEDEASLILLEKNMDMLTKRLTEKGYQANAKLMLREESGGVMEEILKTDKNVSMIGSQSFDVRA